MKTQFKIIETPVGRDIRIIEGLAFEIQSAVYSIFKTCSFHQGNRYDLGNTICVEAFTHRWAGYASYEMAYQRHTYQKRLSCAYRYQCSVRGLLALQLLEHRG